MCPRDSWCVWITGLPGSGKSVVSQALLKLLKQHNIQAQILSSDALRKIITPQPTYSEKERDMVYEALVLLAKHLTKHGINVIIDATGNRRRYRNNARKQIPNFIEIYLKCPLEICIQRETKRGKTFHAPKNIYQKALKSEAPTVPGIGAPYEPPLKPELAIDTTKHTPKQTAQKILQTIQTQNLFKS